MIEVLSVVSEVYPLIKTGGLADVAGALPGALSAHGVSMRTLVPGYPGIIAQTKGGRVVAEFSDLFSSPARLIAGRFAGLDLIVLEASHLYDRTGGPYVDETGKDWPDNWKRFAALSWVAGQLGLGLVAGYAPQILHAHDWQAGLVPAYVKYGPSATLKSVMTVHNLAFQGRFDATIFSQLDLPAHAFYEGVEYYGGVGYLKAGLQNADVITTVSPTYAREIRTPEYGVGLDGLLNARADALVGITNGIDLDAWDPSRDPGLTQSFGVNSIHKRAANKSAVIERFGLENDDGPLFAMVSRLTWQKGVDMLVECLEGLVAQGGKLCVLGSGDPELEAAIKAGAARHPGRIGFVIGYDETLSHLVQGGADAILIPSRFEPCGLTQLFGLRYGCVPVVARVGGLADTVIDANEAAVAAGVATGVQFSPATALGLGEAIRRTIELYGNEKIWRKMQRRGMKADVSWDLSAVRYAEIYANLLGLKTDHDALVD